MNNYKIINDLTLLIRKFPGLGLRSAEKIAHSFISWTEVEIDELISVLNRVKFELKKCPICGSIMEKSCPFCDNPERDHHTIMIIESIKDLLNIENTRTYFGLYHLLVSDKGIESLSFKDHSFEMLRKRLANDINEIIIATNATVEGETKALYISKIAEQVGIKVTRIAYGIQAGSKLEFADDFSIMQAIKSRKEIIKGEENE